MSLSEKIYTVSELTREIKDILEEEFPFIWVEGEISNFRVPPSGHFYFTLKDASSQLRSVFFRSGQGSLNFVPEDGLQVLCLGRISVYAGRGSTRSSWNGWSLRAGALCSWPSSGSRKSCKRKVFSIRGGRNPFRFYLGRWPWSLPRRGRRSGIS